MLYCAVRFGSLPEEAEAEAASDEGSEHFDTEVEQAAPADPRMPALRFFAFPAVQANLDLSAWKLSQSVAQTRQGHPVLSFCEWEFTRSASCRGPRSPDDGGPD